RDLETLAWLGGPSRIKKIADIWPLMVLVCRVVKEKGRHGSVPDEQFDVAHRMDVRDAEADLDRAGRSRILDRADHAFRYFLREVIELRLIEARHLREESAIKRG